MLSINNEINKLKSDFYDKYKETENDLIKIKNSLIYKTSKSEYNNIKSSVNYIKNNYS